MSDPVSAVESGGKVPPPEAATPSVAKPPIIPTPQPVDAPTIRTMAELAGETQPPAPSEARKEPRIIDALVINRQEGLEKSADEMADYQLRETYQKGRLLNPFNLLRKIGVKAADEHLRY